MIGGQRVIAVVPARGNSKGVPGKNIHRLNGKPLLGWAIEAAQSVEAIDRVIVSTDSEQVAAVGRDFGAEVYLRPAHLASDDALVADALRDLFRRLWAEGETGSLSVLLEPTSPFRLREDVEGCLKLKVNGEQAFDTVATYQPLGYNPFRSWQIEDGAARPIFDMAKIGLPRQALVKPFVLNGVCYVWDMKELREDARAIVYGKIGAYMMPRERSLEIDEPYDLMIAELLASRWRPDWRPEDLRVSRGVPATRGAAGEADAFG